MTKVFVAPRRTKKPFFFVLERIFPIIAACPLPIPGRKLHRGEAIKAPISGLIIFGIGIFLIFCFGIFGLFFILKINIDPPNKPVKRGSNGSFISRLRTSNPRMPVIKKTNKAENFFFSKRIKMIEMRIRR